MHSAGVCLAASSNFLPNGDVSSHRNLEGPQKRGRASWQLVLGLQLIGPLRESPFCWSEWVVEWICTLKKKSCTAVKAGDPVEKVSACVHCRSDRSLMHSFRRSFDIGCQIVMNYDLRNIKNMHLCNLFCRWCCYETSGDIMVELSLFSWKVTFKLSGWLCNIDVVILTEQIVLVPYFDRLLLYLIRK